VTNKLKGSAWEYDERTDEYYLHLFCPEQPDLNWENPAVRDAVHKIIRFWLDRGVDGFRMDVINYISKYQDLPDAPVVKTTSPWQPGHDFYAAGPRLHEYLKGIGSILDEYSSFSVGEMPCVKDPKEVIKSVRHDRGELNMIFQFDMSVRLNFLLDDLLTTLIVLILIMALVASSLRETGISANSKISLRNGRLSCIPMVVGMRCILRIMISQDQ
jgi:glycosidase